MLPALLLLTLAAHPDTVRFQRQAEPREGAFSLLVPAGWKISGGISRVNPLAANGPLNSVAAKLDMAIEDPTGAIRLRWLPDMNYMDMRRSPAGGMFPTGSNYNGATVMPLLDAASFLSYAARREMPRASAWNVTGSYPLPKAADSYRQLVSMSGVPFQFGFDVLLLTATWQEGGRSWEGAFYTAVQDYGQMGAGLWCNKDTFYVRAPAGELQSYGAVVAIILQSVELNSRWLAGEIQGQITRSEIALRTQQELARLDREILEHRRRTNAEINNQAFHNLMRTEEYVNPITRKTEIGSNEWNHRWVNERGEAIYTDDPNYDPVRHGLTGYQRSPVRKRFPDR